MEISSPEGLDVRNSAPELRNLFQANKLEVGRERHNCEVCDMKAALVLVSYVSMDIVASAHG